MDSVARYFASGPAGYRVAGAQKGCPSSNSFLELGACSSASRRLARMAGRVSDAVGDARRLTDLGPRSAETAWQD